jgi:hypothetical protein
MKLRLFTIGLIIWIAATIALRFTGQRILHPGARLGTLILFAASFLLTAALVRRLCVRFKLPPEEWPAGAVLVLLPTLLLDPFSCAFFPIVFPNMAPEVAGVFGGWMLICCAGGLVGVTFRRRTPS